jgi:hypothetical protein
MCAPYAGPVRWDALFEDMEAQLAAADQLALESEISERVRMDQSAVEFVDRLRGQVGNTLRFRLQGAVAFTGRLSQVGTGWLTLDAGMRSVLVVQDSVQYVEGLNRSTAVAPAMAKRRLGLGAAFRALARDRAEVQVYLCDDGGRISGTIDRVGRDFIEMAVLPVGEVRRPGQVGTVWAIPFASVAAVSSLR